MKLEELQANANVRGILPDSLITVVNVQWFGSEALELTYKDPGRRVANQLLYRHDEPRLEIVEQGRPWSFDGGSLLRLVSEAHRIRLAYLFDPVLAVHTSLVDPLPHQITAVYEAMLPRQPLRFLLADDPGAGKTIMAGLLIKELIVRGDLQRCLVVCPGSLVDQWQDELYRRFHLPFDILTNDKLEAARSGNWFLENNLVIARLDTMYGLAEALTMLGRAEEADRAYKKVIDINEYSNLAELAQEARRKMAEETFKDRAAGTPRPDAVMCCLSAVEKFEKMPRVEVQRIASEIAMKGRTGLDTNDPAQKYELKSLPGNFSGLHLVCLMYVGFKSIDPQIDIGFDLSKEYAAAQALHEKKQIH